MGVKIVLACFIVQASALCPIGYKHDKNTDKCIEIEKNVLIDRLQNLTRRKLNNVIRPSKSDISLLSEKLKFAVKSFVDSEGMIDSYLCPTGHEYDFSKKKCVAPVSRRYFQLDPEVCPYCNLKEDYINKKREKIVKIHPESKESLDVFEIPLYVAKEEMSLADIIENVLRTYQ